MQSDCLSSKQAYELIFDNLTRWNSWYDAAERALNLRHAIDDFVDLELADYHQRVARYNRRASQSAFAAPKAPPLELTLDQLNNDDWQVIASYLKLLKPLKSATMKLQGNVNTTSTYGKPVKRAIWQVLPVFEEFLKAFEDARERHQPQSTFSHYIATSPPRAQYGSQQRRNTRRSKPQASTTTSEPTESSVGPSDQDTVLLDDTTDTESYNDLQAHFSTNINAGWQKLEYYYNKSDVTPVHRAAVLLHPRMKWRWFERYWSSKPAWIADA